MNSLNRLIVAGCVFALFISHAAAEDKVFFLLPNTTTSRFENRDAPFFIEAMRKKAPNAKVVTLNAQGDAVRQQRQVEDAIALGAKVLVYTAVDPNSAARSLAAADRANVPVVLYDHDAAGGKAAAHVVFDSLSVGRAQGKRAADLISKINKTPVKVARIKGNLGEYGTGQYEAGQNQFLKPLIDSGKVKIVCEQFTPGWDPIKAQAFAESCLTRYGDDIDVFVGMNDGTTGGAVAALIARGMRPGQKLVTGGQDATLEALRYVAQGWQDNTVLKDLKIQADATAAVVASILQGKGVPATLALGQVNNKFMDVPAVFLPVANITQDNLIDVVKAGVWTWSQICQGIESTSACQKRDGKVSLTTSK